MKRLVLFFGAVLGLSSCADHLAAGRGGETPISYNLSKAHPTNTASSLSTRLLYVRNDGSVWLQVGEGLDKNVILLRPGESYNRESKRIRVESSDPKTDEVTLRVL